MGEPEPEPEPAQKGDKKPRKKKEPAGQAELRDTIAALQVELAAAEAGREQHTEIMTLIQNLRLQGYTLCICDRQCRATVTTTGSTRLLLVLYTSLLSPRHRAPTKWSL